MPESFYIDPKSMVSVRKQLDLLATAGINITLLMARIAPRIQADIRRRLTAEENLRTKENKKPVADYLEVRVRPVAKAMFEVTIEPKNRKGRMLLEGRKGGRIIRPKSGIAMKDRLTGQFYGSVRQGKFKPPPYTRRIQKLAEKRVRYMTRREIAKIVPGVGIMGGNLGIKGSVK
jgi:hypothetical protein